mmetsp:Transcript_19010/g.65378  ORF Transcript_19010/g.65378 Transcript_19010/m.65378 type:complete len:640 (+) Transcript_19010:122-2041(+)
MESPPSRSPPSRRMRSPTSEASSPASPASAASASVAYYSPGDDDSLLATDDSDATLGFTAEEAFVSRDAAQLKLLRTSTAAEAGGDEGFTTRWTSTYARRVANVAARQSRRSPRYEDVDPCAAEGALRAFLGRSATVAKKIDVGQVDNMPNLTVDHVSRAAYAQQLADLPTGTDASGPATGFSDDTEFAEERDAVGHRMPWLDVVEDGARDWRGEPSGTPWRGEPTASRPSSRRGEDRASPRTQAAWDRKSFEDTKRRVEEAQRELDDARRRGDGDAGLGERSRTPLTDAHGGLGPLAAGAAAYASGLRVDSADFSDASRGATPSVRDNASRPDTSHGQRPTTAEERQQARRAGLAQLELTLGLGLAPAVAQTPAASPARQQRPQVGPAAKSFSCQADGRDAQVGRVLHPRPTKQARAAEVLARQARAAPRRFLHVSDIVAPQPPQPSPPPDDDDDDASYAVPPDAAPHHFELRTDMRGRFEDLDALALELERELDAGRVAMESFQERAANGLRDAAAKNYAVMLDAAHRVTRQPGDDGASPLGLDSPGASLRASGRHGSPPPPPLTASAEWRAARHLDTANEAYLELRAALEANERNEANGRRRHVATKPAARPKPKPKPRPAPPKPQWRDPKGTALW